MQLLYFIHLLQSVLVPLLLEFRILLVIIIVAGLLFCIRLMHFRKVRGRDPLAREVYRLPLRRSWGQTQRRKHTRSDVAILRRDWVVAQLLQLKGVKLVRIILEFV